MRSGFVILVLSYVLSQFYRAFLAVLSPALEADLGASAADLSLASGLWFATFAAMQIPVGILLDRAGPRRTAGYLLILGGGLGAVVFATASTPGAIVAAMALIGVGCSPVLMAGFYIFARNHPPAVFASLAGLLMGLGSAGNLASAAPLAWAAEAFGWRAIVWAAAAVTLAVGAGLLAILRDPEQHGVDSAGSRISLAEVLRQPALWVMVPLMIVNYAPVAGTRGLWAGPYLADVFGMDAGGIGTVTLWMAGAMIAGSLAYGPLDRLLGTRKWVIIAGNLAAAACLLALWAAPAGSPVFAAVFLTGLGLFGMSFPMIVAHGRSFFPPHLTGRGVTLVNLLSIGGVGVLQIASGRIHSAQIAAGGAAEAPYAAIFLFFALLMVIGCGFYAFSEDRLD